MALEKGMGAALVESRLGYVPAIDGLRAIAVSSVVFFHVNNNWLPGGFVGVDIFFVISGYVVTASIAHLKFDSLSVFLTYFYARRIVRIAPALIVCLLAAGIASTLFIPQAWLSNNNNFTGLAAFFGGSNFVLVTSYNEYFAPRSEFNPFTQTWSLGVEEQFYFIFPLLSYYVVRRLGRDGDRQRLGVILLVLCLISLGLCIVLSALKNSYAFYMLPPRFWELGVGVLLFLNFSKLHVFINSLSTRAATLSFLACGVCLSLAMFYAEADRFPFPWALPAVAGAAGVIVLIVSLPSIWFTRILSASGLVFIGQISYSLYLWHWPIFVLCRWTVGLEDTRYQMLAIGLAFGMATLSHRYVEQPVRLSPGVRSAPRWRVVAIGVPIVILSAIGYRAVVTNQQYLSLSVTANYSKWFGFADIAVPTSQCVVEERQETFAGHPILVFKPHHCPTHRSGHKMFVLGDSHATAYEKMLRKFAADSGNDVHILARPGCRLLSLSETDPACDQFLESVVGPIASGLSPGDVLFLPSLRLPRFGDQWGSIAKHGHEINGTLPGKAEVLARTTHMLTRMSKPGVSIVFEAPKPIFRSPIFRCIDWFNVGNPACAGGLSIRRQELLALRQPVMDAMQIVVHEVHGVSIWDPLSTLCGEEACDAIIDNKPLYVDGDHLSGFANDMLLSSFTAHIQYIKRGVDVGVTSTY